MDDESIKLMCSLMKNNYENPSQQYMPSKKARDILEESRCTIAKNIGADPEEIFFTSGGSESDNWAIRCTHNKDESRKKTIISAIEHSAIYNNTNQLTKTGIVDIINPNNKGFIEESTLKQIIDDNTRLVSIMMVNNELGTIQPIKELSKISHECGSLFHTDAVQAVGHLKIDVKELDVDLLSASAHKFNGPKGIGFLYVKKGITIDPLIVGGKQEKGKRAGTENVPAISSMAFSLNENCKNIEVNQKRIKSMEKRLIDGLNKEQIEYKVNTQEPHMPGIINISFKEIEGEALMLQMGLYGISISTGSACNSGVEKKSRVLTSIGMPDENIASSVRISLGKNNTNDEVDYIVQTLSKIINRK
jgi:cysteine desulfurase